MGSAPLEGITAVALEQAVAAPLATRHLADLGARVIKIERPGVGDFARAYDRTVMGLSSHFVWLNRSKQSFTLDAKHERAPEILQRLLSTADVFVQNLAPGAADRLGLGPDVLVARYPRLIIANISGFGPDGPYRDKKAYDLLIQAETGLMAVTGTEQTPSKSGIPPADIAAGMYALSGILTALYRRERSGEGAVLDISLFDALGEWMGYPAYYTAYSGTAPRRCGPHHAAVGPYGPFTAGDGKTVMLGIQNEREWAAFCTSVLKQPELEADARFADNSARVAHREELETIINKSFDRMSAAEVIEQLDAARIANARLNSVQEFWDHPQLAARDRWRSVDTSAGPVRALLPPLEIRGTEIPMTAVPEVGQHTTAILAEMGYSAEEIETLRKSAAV